MTKISKAAVFNFQKSDESLIDELAEYLDTHVSNVYEFFEIEPTGEKVNIDIIPTKKEFDEIYFKEYGHTDFNARGFAKNGNQIYYLSINDYQNTAHAFKPKEKQEAIDGFKKTLVHEFAHCVNVMFNKKHECSMTAKYLVEGIAVYLSHQKDDVKPVFDFSLERLLGKQECPYLGYFLTTKYFVEHYDKKFVLNMFESSRQANELLENELYAKVCNFYNHNISKNKTKKD